MSPDHYLSIGTEGEGLFRDKASRFIGIAFQVCDEEQFKERLLRLQKEHHGARHFCYAWTIGVRNTRHRANDDGEPAGTAGKPILNRIRAAGLSDAGVIVLRYFGGTLLGKAGLVQAYGEAARLALEAAVKVDLVLRDNVHITCTYAQLEGIRNTVLASGGYVLDSSFTDAVTLRVALPLSRVEALCEAWRTQGIQAAREDQGK